MSSQWDIIIIGAGPSGCGAAYDLSALGKSVLLIDKKTFPRLKPCAGAVTVKAVNALRYSIAPVIRQVCCDFRVGLRTERSAVFSSRYPVAAMTVRSEFDAYCLQKCLNKGAHFEQVQGLSAITKDNGTWTIATAGKSFQTRFLIGADGANSQVRRLLDVTPPIQCGVAMEACVPTHRAGEFQMEMDFGVVERGYGWIFPKGDHLNIGLYTLDKTIHGGNLRLAEYCKAKTGIPFKHTIHGHKIPYGGKAFRHVCGSAFLVGDAAGLIDPLMGEGIYNAIRSGQLAAAAVLDQERSGNDSYDRHIREITADLASYDFDTSMFYGNVNRGYRHLNLWPVRAAIMKGFALGLPFRQIKRRFWVLPFLKPKNYLMPV